ncbi:hypothetical protein [Metallibacterium scheffleri]|uniref:hypothetical protein n=1 Tax=Metallibacterium scheffleri TaxID=993689 RepID=UPI00109F2326|nr:hypothetical protein [Metallibacterium scheffleri]
MRASVLRGDCCAVQANDGGRAAAKHCSDQLKDWRQCAQDGASHQRCARLCCGSDRTKQHGGQQPAASRGENNIRDGARRHQHDGCRHDQYQQRCQIKANHVRAQCAHRDRGHRHQRGIYIFCAVSGD